MKLTGRAWHGVVNLNFSTLPGFLGISSLGRMKPGNPSKAFMSLVTRLITL